MTAGALTLKWCPRCPVCTGVALRDPALSVADCKCQHCGWHFTSSFKRAVIRALSRRPGDEICDGCGGQYTGTEDQCQRCSSKERINQYKVKRNRP